MITNFDILRILILYLNNYDFIQFSKCNKLYSRLLDNQLYRTCKFLCLSEKDIRSIDALIIRTLKSISVETGNYHLILNYWHFGAAHLLYNYMLNDLKRLLFYRIGSDDYYQLFLLIKRLQNFKFRKLLSLHGISRLPVGFDIYPGRHLSSPSQGRGRPWNRFDLSACQNTAIDIFFDDLFNFYHQYYLNSRDQKSLLHPTKYRKILDDILKDVKYGDILIFEKDYLFITEHQTIVYNGDIFDDNFIDICKLYNIQCRKDFYDIYVLQNNILKLDIIGRNHNIYHINENRKGRAMLINNHLFYIV